MQENKNKKFAYLVIAVAAGLILNEIAPTSYIKSQLKQQEVESFQLRQKAMGEVGLVKFGIISNFSSNLNSNFIDKVLKRYKPKKSEKDKDKRIKRKRRF